MCRDSLKRDWKRQSRSSSWVQECFPVKGVCASSFMPNVFLTSSAESPSDYSVPHIVTMPAKVARQTSTTGDQSSCWLNTICTYLTWFGHCYMLHKSQQICVSYVSDETDQQGSVKQAWTSDTEPHSQSLKHYWKASFEVQDAATALAANICALYFCIIHLQLTNFKTVYWPRMINTVKLIKLFTIYL